MLDEPSKTDRDAVEAVLRIVTLSSKRDWSRTLVVLGLFVLGAALALSGVGFGHFLIGFGTGLAFTGWTFHHA